MKKLIIGFALLGFLAVLVPKQANAGNTYPGRYIICGHVCFCNDAQDYDFYWNLYCE